jgi:hypothetical protein
MGNKVLRVWAVLFILWLPLLSGCGSQAEKGVNKGLDKPKQAKQ